jgi:hypothetical protein
MDRKAALALLREYGGFAGALTIFAGLWWSDMTPTKTDVSIVVGACLVALGVCFHDSVETQPFPIRSAITTAALLIAGVIFYFLFWKPLNLKATGPVLTPPLVSIVPKLPVGSNAFPIIFEIRNGQQTMLAVDIKCVFDRVVLADREGPRVGPPNIDNIGSHNYVESIAPNAKGSVGCRYPVGFDTEKTKVAEATVTLNVEFGEPDKPGRQTVRHTFRLVSDYDRLLWEQTDTRDGPLPEVGHLAK